MDRSPTRRTFKLRSEIEAEKLQAAVVSAFTPAEVQQICRHYPHGLPPMPNASSTHIPGSNRQVNDITSNEYFVEGTSANYKGKSTTPGNHESDEIEDDHGDLLVGGTRVTPTEGKNDQGEAQPMGAKKERTYRRGPRGHSLTHSPKVTRRINITTVRYTVAEIEWLIAATSGSKAQEIDWDNVVQAFNHQFKSTKTRQALRVKCLRLRNKAAATSSPGFTSLQLEWILDQIPGMNGQGLVFSWSNVAELFNATFDKNLTDMQLQAGWVELREKRRTHSRKD